MKALTSFSFNLLLLICILVLSSEAVKSQPNLYAEIPHFSHTSGFYSGSIFVTISVSSPTATIRYTLDCTDPTEESILYTVPIEVNQTTVVRAKAFESGFNPSKIISHTYLIDQNFNIPVLSVITDPSNLWGENGIYSNPENRGDEWERPATIEFFESNGSPGFSSDVGIRIHGGTSRVFEKKSFRYYFRSEYGQSRLCYHLFRPKQIYEFKRFVTSASFQDAPANSAYDSGTLLRDAVLHEIGRHIEQDIVLGTRPVALFLAGKPWGIYNAIERIDDHLVTINFGIDSCDMIENYSTARENTMDRWNEMISFFESTDLSIPQNYEKTKSYIDIQNFTRYNIVEIYGGNMDWPDNNNFAYCGYQPGDKWKWILWDLDNTFAYTSANTFELATDDKIKGTLILRKLLENEEYKRYFLNECADFFNTVFQPERVKSIIDSLAAIIRHDLWFEIDRWGGTIEEWEANVQFLKNFADYRLDRLWQYILWELDVSDKHLLSLQAPQGGQGRVRINNIYIDQFPWSGYYFKDNPIELEAVPDAGFKVKGWNDTSLSSEKKVSLVLQHDYVVYPIFEQVMDTVAIIINEINYNSAADFDPEDWVELYNPSDQTIDVSGWHFQDDNETHDFQFPDETTIDPDGFLIVCRDEVAFHDLFPDITNYIGDLGFGLGGNGDAVKIYNSSYLLIDSVNYDDKSPWPLEADGNGPTLELVNPQLDNTVPENWRASPGYGSPGKPNLYMPQITKFVVTDSSGSVSFTNNRNVLIEMAEADSDGNVVQWLINENPEPPAADDVTLTTRPTNYHIESAEGTVAIYCWVLDNDNQVNKLTSTSQASIKLDLTKPGFTVNVLDSLEIEIVYSEAVMGAEDANNYEITPALGSITIIDHEANRCQLITNQQQNPGIIYHLSISNVTDSAGNFLARDLFSFSGYGGLFKPIKLKLIKSSRSNFGQGWHNSIDGDIRGWDGTVKAGGDPCFAIFGFADQQMHTINKIRLLTDSGIGASQDWVREFTIEISDTGIKPQSFVQVLQAEKNGGNWEQFPVDSIHARFIKFTVIQPSHDWCQLAEFEVWGQDSREGLAPEKFSPNPEHSTLEGNINNNELSQNELTNHTVFSNFPNPFNERTHITFQLLASSHVRLTIYNIIGEEINTLVDEWKSTGKYQISWDGRDNSGFTVPSGIYILQMNSDGFHQSRKLILMK